MLRSVGFVAAIALITAGCGGEPLLREYYSGRSLLEPHKTADPPARDGDGNPILSDQGWHWPAIYPWRRDLTAGG